MSKICISANNRIPGLFQRRRIYICAYSTLGMASFDFRARLSPFGVPRTRGSPCHSLRSPNLPAPPRGSQTDFRSLAFSLCARCAPVTQRYVLSLFPTSKYTSFCAIDILRIKRTIANFFCLSYVLLFFSLCLPILYN